MNPTFRLFPWGLAFLLSGCGAASAPPVAPNVLLISIDTLRADHLGLYGYERDTSPKLDAFARTATVFENTQAASSWTLPGMASLFTSTYTSTHKCWGYDARLDNSFTTLAEVLLSSGYDTACVVGHLYCTTRHGLQQGFVHFDDAFAFPEDDADETVTSDLIADKGIQFLEQKQHAPDGTPWLLWLHFFDPHAAYREHEGFSEAFVTPGKRSPVRASLDRYDGEIAFTDHHVGRVLDALERTALDESTIVVVVSDHGEEFRDHGSPNQHGHSLFAELVRVPFVIRAPGVQPSRVAGTTRTIDLVPTLLDFAGLPALEQAVGRSLRASMNGAALSTAPALSEVRLAADNQWESVVEGTLKFIRRRDPGEQPSDRKLFDLAVDPGEQNNLVLQRAADATRLEQQLESLIEQAVTRGEGFGTSQAAISADQYDALNDLGYLGEDGQ